jgi:hypothetical protein
MNEILFKTNPRLILVGTFFSGFLLFLLLSLLCLQTVNGEYANLGYLFFGIFVIFSVACLYYLFKVKILIITKSELIIRNFLLPKKRQIKLEEIKYIKQKKELVKFYLGIHMFEKASLLNNYKTNLELKNGEKIELISVTSFEFSELEKFFFKLKRSEGKIKKPKKNFSLYILENSGAIIGLFFLNLLNIGLLYGIIKNSC